MNIKKIIVLVLILATTDAMTAQNLDSQLVEEDFYIVETATSEVYPILGTGIDDFVERYGPPLRIDEASAPQGRIRRIFPGFSVDSSIRTGSVLSVRFLDDSVRTMRGVRIGDPRSAADEAYPVGYYYREDNYIVGYYSIPESMLDNQYYLAIEFDETDSVADIRFGLAID